VAFNFGAQPFLYSPQGYQPVDVSAKITAGTLATTSLQQQQQQQFSRFIRGIAEESGVGRAKPPFMVRAVMEQVDMVSRFLTRQPLPLLFLGDAMVCAIVPSFFCPVHS
jgi:hypothetical protein